MLPHFNFVTGAENFLVELWYTWANQHYAKAEFES